MISMEEKSINSKFPLKGKKIWVAGHNGMVGRSIVKKLKNEDCTILTSDKIKLDLTSQIKVDSWIKKNKPDVIFLVAAKVGGILANINYPKQFLYDNTIISFNVINSAHKYKVKKLIFLGSSCIYPANCRQPIREDYLLKGELEKTNEWYSLAKIAGIKLCQALRIQENCDFISVMPTNLYGPFDNFHPDESHVPAALLSRTHQAKIKKKDKVIVWGTGKPLREFMHVYDLADALIFISKNYSSLEPINVGTGKEVSIKKFAFLIKEIVDFKGKIYFDHTRPDGIKRKLLDSSKISSLGWKPKINLVEGMKEFYKWYLDNST